MPELHENLRVVMANITNLRARPGGTPVTPERRRAGEVADRVALGAIGSLGR
jgi:hypothetical protein